MTDYAENGEHVYTGEAKAAVGAYLKAVDRCDGTCGHPWCAVIGGLLSGLDAA